MQKQADSSGSNDKGSPKEAGASGWSNMFKETEVEKPSGEKVIYKTYNVQESEKERKDFKWNLDEPTFKLVKPKTTVFKAKETIRKLPMFETFHNEADSIDFEWPNRANLKMVNDVKQLKLKEIKYH